LIRICTMSGIIAVSDSAFNWCVKKAMVYLWVKKQWNIKKPFKMKGFDKLFWREITSH
jgi:hypothetical protein